MPSRVVFSDLEGNEMNCYLNKDTKVYIGVGNPEDGVEHLGYITLEKADVRKLIEVLTDCEKEMED